MGKDLFQSTTTWSVLIGLFAQIIKMFGVEIEINADATANDIVTAISAVGVLYGRVKAVTPITSILGKKLNKPIDTL